MEHWQSFIIQIVLIVFTSILLSVLIPHFSAVINPNLHGWKMDWSGVSRAMKNEFNHSRYLIIISIIVILLAISALWFTTDNSETNNKLDSLIKTVEKQSQQIEGLSQQIEKMIEVLNRNNR
jgi:hypothetical protein